MDIGSLISGAGIGAILATIIQSWMTNSREKKQRIFQEKKDAYVGFLQAMHASEVHPSDEASSLGGYWINICKIVGSKEVNDLLEKHLETNPINGKMHPDRPKILQDLYAAMRKDLGFPKA